MEVILLEKIRNLGALGDKVKVKPGYGRNFLVPKGKAVYATVGNIEKFEARRAELEKAAAEKYKAAETRLQALTALGTITISAKTGDEGKLFGSIGVRDIAAAINDAGFHVEKSEIHLPHGVIRNIGEFDIEVELHNDITTVVKLIIAAEA